MSWDSPSEALEKLKKKNYAHWDGFLGFYSSWLGGYFREPWAMQIPMDEHGFHRGDAVFEAARLHTGAYFDLQAHLKRLERSAQAIGMELPISLAEIENICVELAKRCGAPEGILRLYVTRGPGGFSPSPKEVVGHQIYAAITKLSPPSADKYANGVRAMFSTVDAKDSFWSQIKSCNYLQNVLMKQECIARGVDFAISVDPEGRLCEGSTENMFLVTQGNEMIVPKFDYTLRGTTIQVVMKLAEKLVASGKLKSVGFGDLTKKDLFEAREAAFVGTTLGVLPMTEIDGKKIGGVGEIAKDLHQSLMQVMASSTELRTPYGSR